MASVITDTIKEISLQYTHAEEAGENLINGVNKGIGNESVQNSAFKTISAFGDRLLSKLKKSLDEKSPSKATDQMGRYLLVGLQNGIDKTERATVKDAEKAGEEVLNALNNSLKGGVDFDPLHGDFKSFVKEVNGALSGITLQPLDRLDKTTVNSAVASYKNTMAGIKATDTSLNNALKGDIINGKSGNSNVTYNFTQNNTSPKPLNRLEIYRQTRNQLNFAAGV